uniref:Uncharacterized protein n=1 Tax=Glossina austeni TaxID=7395 RepID=A0A1A9VVQ6_GLOAU
MQDIPHIKHGVKTKSCVVVKKSLGHKPLHNEQQLLLKQENDFNSHCRLLFVHENPTVGNLCVYGFGTFSVVPVICVNFTLLSRQVDANYRGIALSFPKTTLNEYSIVVIIMTFFTSHLHNTTDIPRKGSNDLTHVVEGTIAKVL